jgi:hypothetical protein
MKKLHLWLAIATGALIGLLASIPDGWGVKIGMILLGSLVGVAIGGAIARIGKRAQSTRYDEDALAGLGVSPEDIARNYWRDKGRPPLTSSLKPELGSHQFDPEHFD